MRLYNPLLMAATVLSVSVLPVSAQQTVTPPDSTLQAAPSSVPSPTSTPTPTKPLKPAKVIDSLGDFAIAPPDQPHGCEAHRFYSSDGDGGKIICDSVVDFEHGFGISTRLKKNCDEQLVGQVRKYVCIITD